MSVVWPGLLPGPANSEPNTLHVTKMSQLLSGAGTVRAVFSAGALRNPVTRRDNERMLCTFCDNLKTMHFLHIFRTTKVNAHNDPNIHKHQDLFRIIFKLSSVVLILI